MLVGKIAGSSSFGPISAEVNIEAEASAKFSKQTQTVVAMMKIERYYSSVKEEVSPLLDDSFALLERKIILRFSKLVDLITSKVFIV